jgi:hypothetical protein
VTGSASYARNPPRWHTDPRVCGGCQRVDGKQIPGVLTLGSGTSAAERLCRETNDENTMTDQFSKTGLEIAARYTRKLDQIVDKGWAYQTRRYLLVGKQQSPCIYAGCTTAHYPSGWVGLLQVADVKAYQGELILNRRSFSSATIHGSTMQ